MAVLHGAAAGLCFRDMNGGQAAQCLLMQRLACTRTGQQLVAATFHMKAKTGATNDSIRRSQVWRMLHGSQHFIDQHGS